MQSIFMARAALFVAAVALSAEPRSAQGLSNSHAQAETHNPSNLEQRLRTTYEALPRGEGGLPEASAVRYLAQRFLTAEHGRWVHGLDRTPLHGSRNATELAFKRAAELLQVPKSLPQSDKEALLAVQGSRPGRGFTLGEAAAFVKAVENILADTDMAVMRRAHGLAKQLTTGKASPKLRSVLMTYATLYMSGTEAEDLYVRNMKQPKARKRLEEELQNTMDRLRNDIAGQPLEEVLRKAEQAMSPSANGKAGHKALEGMRVLRRKLDERQYYECSRFQGLLRTMDAEGKGQVSFRNTFGVTMKDWALLETPEYLNAVGALQQRYPSGAGPGVLIPNYVTGMNSCKDSFSWHASVCCPDECEIEILPRLEAASRGTHLTPKQVWQAVYPPLQAGGSHGAAAKKALRARLRRLGARSADGKVAVHGRPLGLWLHQAFPHKCRKPVPSGSPLVVDPALSPTLWERSGKHLPLEPELVAEVRAHLQRRWGKDGTGQDIASFAARSRLGLDAEFELIRRFHAVHKAGGLPVEQQLENALNVRVMKDQPLRVLHLSALTTAAALLGLFLFALSLAARLAAAVAAAASAAAAAAAARAAAAAPACCGALSSAGTSARACANRVGAAVVSAVAAPMACMRRSSAAAAGAGAAAGGCLAQLCDAAAAVLTTVAASLGQLGQELSPGSKSTGPRKPAQGSPRAQRAEDDSTDTGETDSEVAGEHTSDSEGEDLSKEKYSRALLLQYRPAGQPSKAKQPEEIGKLTMEEEQEEAAGACHEEATGEAPSTGSPAEPAAPEAPEEEKSPAKAEAEPAPAGAPAELPEEPPRSLGRAPPGLEAVTSQPSQPEKASGRAPALKAGSLTGLLAASTSLRPSKPAPGRKPTSLLSELLAESTSLAPSTRKPAASRPEQKSGAEGSWRSQPPGGAGASEANWRSPAARPAGGDAAAARPEQSWRGQGAGASDPPRRSAAEPERSSGEDGDSLLAFVCRQLESY